MNRLQYLAILGSIVVVVVMVTIWSWIQLCKEGSVKEGMCDTGGLWIQIIIYLLFFGAILILPAYFAFKVCDNEQKTTSPQNTTN